MEVISIISYVSVLLLGVVGIPVALALLLYFVPKKLGYPKAAKYLTRIYGVLMLAIVLSTVFEDLLFTRNDAKELVEEQNIQLRDQFIMSDNRSSSGIGDYYHTFTLEISENDRQEAIRTIISSKDFITDEKMLKSLPHFDTGRYFGPKIIQNYENKDSYVRQYFQPAGRKGYAPTFRRISVSKTDRKLIFEDIDD